MPASIFAKGLSKIREMSAREGIGLDSRLSEAGFDSLDLVEWISYMEDESGREIDVKKLDINSLGDMTVRDVVIALGLQG